MSHKKTSNFHQILRNLTVELREGDQVTIWSDGYQVHYKNVGIFKIRQNPLAYSVEPAYATVHGGVNVTILGANFAHSAPMGCRFDERNVPICIKNMSRVIGDEASIDIFCHQILVNVNTS